MVHTVIQNPPPQSDGGSGDFHPPFKEFEWNHEFVFLLQEGEKLVKKIGGVFAFKVKDGPGGKEATWTVDVKNGKGSVTTDSGSLIYLFYSKQL